MKTVYGYWAVLARRLFTADWKKRYPLLTQTTTFSLSLIHSFVTFLCDPGGRIAMS